MREYEIFHGVRGLYCTYKTSSVYPLVQGWACKINHTVSTLEGEKSKQTEIFTNKIQTFMKAENMIDYNVYSESLENAECHFIDTEKEDILICREAE